MDHIKKKDQLNDDLVVEILSRLPAKSLVRFRCVSKSWLRIAFDPHYRKLFPAAMSGVFHNVPDHGPRYHRMSSDRVTDGSFTFLPTRRDPTIVDCCNGLLLCRGWIGKRDTPFFVCNPATKKWAPVPFGLRRRRSFFAPTLAFDPRHSRHHFVLLRSRLGNMFEIFSSETGDWIQIRAPLRDICYVTLSRGAYFNGSFHVFSYPNYIARIDLERKVSRRFELPDSNLLCEKGRFGESGGYLHYAGNPDSAQMLVWVLEDYDSVGWVLRHSVDISAAISNHHDSEVSSLASVCLVSGEVCSLSPVLFDILAFHPHTDVVFLQVRDVVLSYDWKNGTLTRVFTSMSKGHKCFFPYSPCLLEGLDLYGAFGWLDRKWEDMKPP